MLKLVASASLHTPLGDAPQDLRAQVREATGREVRRVNRFIELALLGAHRCARALPQGIASDAALMLCYDGGMLADTARIMAGYARERRAPTPFEFMNTSGGVAGFQVAQMLGLNGPQLTVHRNFMSLEAALQLLRLRSARARRVLVGFVEEGAWPLADQERRLDWNGRFSECSHWLYFDEDAAAPGARIESCTPYADGDSLAHGLQGLRRDDLYFAGVDANRSQSAQSEAWPQRLGIVQRFEVPELAGQAPCYSGGLPALALSAFARSGLHGRLLLVNRNAGGEFFATVVSKC